mgnify:CR=1 FL=1
MHGRLFVRQHRFGGDPRTRRQVVEAPHLGAEPGQLAGGVAGGHLLVRGDEAVHVSCEAVARGPVGGPDGILAFPAAILIGFAFGAAGVAATTYMRTWQDLDLVTLVTLPLFLFSATFYPIDVYPEFIQIVARLSPLYHGVVLIRGLTLGILEWTMLINVAYLAAWGIVGSTITSRRVGVLLLK